MFRILAVPALALGVATSGHAQDMRVEAVHFAPGTSSTEINDTITGYESIVYTLGANRGQRMKIRFEPSNTASYFNVYAPGKGPGDKAWAVSQYVGDVVPDINYFDGVLPESGEYSISVYMMRSAARRDEVSNYGLYISVD